MTGIEAFLEVLAAAGVTHLFGNPGTTELPLNEAVMADPRFRYVFGIHEIPVMAMADGYAQATRQVAVVNLHIGCGLGNAMGMLYNAHVEGTPLLVTAGQQDRRLRFDEPVLEADLVRVARPWTKWAAEVGRVEDMPNAVRRAVQTALTPPTGPVFLSLPIDVQMAEGGDLDVRGPSVPDRRLRPSADVIRRAAKALSEAKRPAILAGSRVLEADATAELATLAELLGAPIYAEATTGHGRMPVRSDHPLYQGVLPYWSPDAAQTLKDFDVLFVIGMNLLRLYIFQDPAQPIRRDVRIVQVDPNACEIGKNYPVEVGVLGDPKAALCDLIETLNGESNDERRDAAATRRATWENARRAATRVMQEKLEASVADGRLSSLRMMRELARALPPDAVVVEEAITSHHNVLETLGVLNDAAAQFAHRGWALGWGLGCALGVKLAWPQRPVVALIGDGAALYGIQALWSAAHERIPVTFLICNNRQYKILKLCGDQLDMPALREPACPGMNLSAPAVDFVALAKGFGVRARRITQPEELGGELKKSLEQSEASLLEVVLEGE